MNDMSIEERLKKAEDDASGAYSFAHELEHLIALQITRIERLEFTVNDLEDRLSSMEDDYDG